MKCLGKFFTLIASVEEDKVEVEDFHIDQGQFPLWHFDLARVKHS